LKKEKKITRRGNGGRFAIRAVKMKMPSAGTMDGNRGEVSYLGGRAKDPKQKKEKKKKKKNMPLWGWKEQKDLGHPTDLVTEHGLYTSDGRGEAKESKRKWARPGPPFV